MSTDTLLPGMPSDTTGGRKIEGQWTLARLQLINWGGFDGYHDCEFSRRGNLISGASGTGKSTVLDAYIALMMESNIPFNGASNDGGTGRARGEKQRNLLSYMRGLTDTTRDEHSDEARERVLRGDGQATWSAVAATWQHTDGSRHTGMRIYYARADATTTNDVNIHFAQCIGEFNIRNLEPFAADKFHHRKVNSHYPNLVFSESYPKWCHRLHVRLGIGRDGDGTQALRLLARIQAGRTITSVDGLFKEMVLEKPRTYDAAEQAVEHFRELEAAYELMCTAQEQIDTLTPIVEMHTALEQARLQYELLDTFGLGAASAHGPVPLWAARTEQRLLEAETAAAKQRRNAGERDERTADGDVRKLKKQLLDNERLQVDSGGGDLAALALRCEELDATLELIRNARAEFGPRAPMHTLPTTAAELGALQDQARTTVAEWPQLKQSLEQEARDLGREQWPLENERAKIAEEVRYLEGRNNLVPPRLDEARLRIAEHLGLDPAELPFVAELIDLQAEREQWREAAELLLGGFARTMLIDRRHTQFRRSINELRLRERVNFNLVAVDMPSIEIDDSVLPGRLQYADDSPFTGWLQAELARNYAYLCLDTPEFPADGRKAITLTGQVQNGSRGAHGGHGSVKILGFSNAARLEELGRQKREVDEHLAALETRSTSLQTRTRAAEALKDAATYLLDLTWDDLDLTGTQALRDAAQEQHDLLLEGSDVLAQLREEHEQLTKQHEQRQKDRARAQIEFEAADKLWSDLIEREDVVSRELDELDDAGAQISDEQHARLDEEYGRYTTATTSSSDLTGIVAKMRRALLEQVSREADTIKDKEAGLSRIFGQFQKQWPSHNRDTGPEAYPEYKTLLDELIADGLAARRKEFADRVIDWSSEDLLGLAGAFDEAIDEIKDRLDPVNDVLAKMPFGAHSDRLNIRLRPLRSSDMTAFRQELNELARVSTRIDADDVENRFEKLAEFMTRIKPSSTSRERDQLLDVRRHVHLEAARVDVDTDQVHSVYDSLGSKSGGETQELVAFIVGAALRYRLGIEDNSQPGYAPVLLDEAFIKADSEFAGRAVRAWQALGFQLIIGAPMDKVSAIEPYVDRMIGVLKQDSYSYLHALPAGPAVPPQHQPT